MDVRIRAYNHHTVPRVLYAREREVFSPYFAGQVYYRPHHHYHVVYRFPVLMDGVVVYRPYYYCENRLFVAAAVPMPRLAFGVEFGPSLQRYTEFSRYVAMVDAFEQLDTHRADLILSTQPPSFATPARLALPDRAAAEAAT